MTIAACGEFHVLGRYEPRSGGKFTRPAGRSPRRSRQASFEGPSTSGAAGSRVAACEYSSGAHKTFHVKLIGTDFQISVRCELLGETRSYGEIAHNLARRTLYASRISKLHNQAAIIAFVQSRYRQPIPRRQQQMLIACHPEHEASHAYFTACDPLLCHTRASFALVGAPIHLHRGEALPGTLNNAPS